MHQLRWSPIVKSQFDDVVTVTSFEGERPNM